MATITNLTQKLLSPEEVALIFSTNHRSANFFLNNFDTSSGENSSFWESSDRDTTTIASSDHDESEVETEYNRMVSNGDPDTCADPGLQEGKGEAIVITNKSESSTEGADEADLVLGSPKHVLRPRKQYPGRKQTPHSLGPPTKQVCSRPDLMSSSHSDDSDYEGHRQNSGSCQSNRGQSSRGHHSGCGRGSRGAQSGNGQGSH